MTVYLANDAGKAPRNAVKANGTSKAASRLQDEIVWRSRRAADIVARGGQELKGKGLEAFDLAHDQFDRAAVVAGKAGRQLAAKGRQTAFAARKHPVQTTLLAAGLGLGLALLLNGKVRGTVTRVAKHLWDDYGSIAFPLLTAIAIPTKAIARP
ncbi:MAG: hypothetical protein ABIO39_10465 [Caulobacteraceae bacterium]